MAATIYALLVGINEYQGRVPHLSGCVNDVREMLSFLEGRTQGGAYDLKPLILTAGDRGNLEERKPTRDAVIEAFRTHLTRAGEGDIALFYYSGHGSQEKAPPEFWHIEPDHLDETIVCYDSRAPGGWDVADKELAALIAEVAQKNPHVLVILDSCHSGSGTRAADGTQIRLAETDKRDRPLDSFLPGALAAAKVEEEAGMEAGGWFRVPEGRHVVLSACRAEQSAREKIMDNGQRRGVFSYYLLDTLQGVGPTLTYRDAFSRVNALVRNLISDQSPLLAATNSTDLQRPFLGGAIVEQMPYYDVNFRDGEWLIAAGAIHGIAEAQDGETTHLALFPLDRVLKPGDDLSQRLADGTVRQVGGGESLIDVTLRGGATLDEEQSYKAVVVSTPLPPVAVFLEGNDEGALGALRGRLQGSKIARVVEDVSAAAIRVHARQTDSSYELKRAGDREPLAVVVEGKGSEAGLSAAQAKVEHMAQWMQVLSLDNKQSALPADAVTMEVYRYDRQSRQRELLDPAAGIELAYDPREARNGLPFQLRLAHTGRYPEPLYCMLVNLTDDFGIATGDALFGGGVWLQPGEEVWATVQGEPVIYAFVPRQLREKGITSLRDVMKLIVSTSQTDANLLRQDGLEVVLDTRTRGLPGAARGDFPSSTLHRLMRRFPDPTRAIGRGEEPVLSDWRTAQVVVTTRALGAAKEVPADREASVSLADGVMLQGHPALQAKVSLVRFDEGKRDVGNLALPALFRDHPDLAEPFNLRPGRGGDAGESVLILRDVANPDSVTPDEPLIVRADATLGESELVLPVAFDPESELFLPLGVGIPAGHGVEIRVDRLPAPTADSRDLKGSIKLFFQKVAAERFGLDGRTARLAAATVEDGRVVYDDSPITLKEKVAVAGTILLYVHGFTGDTRGMVSSAYGLKEAVEPALPRLVEQYDLILAWDYESLNTPIAESALKLKQALGDVGLGPDHGKRVHAIAHSMGCVVTRWFVEREGGNRVVEKVALVAPPNAGTPLAKLQEYAPIGLGAALNGLAVLIWPPAAVPGLVGLLGTGIGLVETVDVAADELKPGSHFYTLLNASDDPGVPYIVVAGNTSKIQYANPSRAEEERSLLRKLAERLTSGETRRALVDLAFFDHPNDMVISVESMLSLPANRRSPTVTVEVACDHSSYFNTQVGLRAVVEKVLAPDA